MVQIYEKSNNITETREIINKCNKVHDTRPSPHIYWTTNIINELIKVGTQLSKLSKMALERNSLQVGILIY